MSKTKLPIPPRRKVAAIAKTTAHTPLTITKTGASLVALELPKNLPFEEWESIGGELGKAEHALSWWIGDWWAFGEARYGDRKSIVEAEDWQGPAFEVCMNKASVCRAFQTSRRREVLSFNHHAEVAADWITPDEQDALLDRAEREGLSVMKLRAGVRALRTSNRLGELIAAPLPAGDPVHILYMDPPWQYENPPMGGGNRSIENHYPTMTLDELRALDISSCATENALLFMWATVPKLAECLTLFEPWGFEYRTNLCWDKIDIGMGYYARNQHELLLIGKRGELPPPQPELRPPSVYADARTEHSRKPAYYAELIERWYPGLRKREFFSRDPARPGWLEPWGNQAVSAAIAAE